MKVEEILDLLAFGELAQTQIGGNEADAEVDNTRYRELIPALNAGLTALHSRFELRLESVSLIQKQGVQTYELDNKHAYSNTESAETRYIVDTAANPFKDNVIRILQIYDACDKLVYINDPSHCNSVYCPTYNSIEFPHVCEDALYRVVYKAKPKKLSYDVEDVGAQEFSLPPAYLNALLSYMAYRYYLNRSGLDGVRQSDSYYVKYENECLRLENKQAVNRVTSSTSNAFEDMGWV